MEQNNTPFCRLEPNLDTLVPHTLVPNIMRQLGLEEQGISSSTCLDDLSLLLQNETWQLRLSAVRRLRLLGPEADQLLLVATQDENAFVRMLAEHALELRGKPVVRRRSKIDQAANLRNHPPPEGSDEIAEEEAESWEKKRDFIGRREELAVFRQWLTDPGFPWILYLHDHEQEEKKKGGVGKTWLLRQYTQLARKIYPDVAIVSVDFFWVLDRDPIVVADRIIKTVKELFPGWSAPELTRAQESYRVAVQEGKEDTSEVRDHLAEALIADLQHLDKQLRENRKYLLLFYDTYELIENDPSMSLLPLSKVVSNISSFKHIGMVLAGRNELDWNCSYWQGREEEVTLVPISPFSPDEVLQYFDQSGEGNLKIELEDVQRIYERSSGRPILLGLINDVMSWHLSNLKTLATIPEDTFEASLVSKINQLDWPIDWIVLFMAHVYHRFNFSLLDWICREAPFTDLLQSTTREQVTQQLLSLSFVRRPDVGPDFVLHDEMRVLVQRYCWKVQDPDQRLRKIVSRSAIRYYEEELKVTQQEYPQHAYLVELLYHKLYLNLDEGYRFFQSHFWHAVNSHSEALARALLREVQSFADGLTLKQRDELKYAERLCEKRQFAFKHGKPYSSIGTLSEAYLHSKRKHPIELFCLYSSEDKAWSQILETSLSQFKQQGLVSHWHGRQISPGTDKKRAIDAHLETGSVILLLISANFLASDYCFEGEILQAMKRHERGEARVVPILLRPADWHNTPFGKLQALPSDGRPITSWSNHEEVFVDIVEGISAVLQDIQPLMASPPAPVSPVWNVPYSRNPFFVGRDVLLTRLSASLKAGQAAALLEPHAIRGMGGIGKTQIAVEYAYQHRQDYQAVLWTPADTRESLIAGYIALARLLGVPQKGEPDQDAVTNAVKTWLQTHDSWLLVLDNADELALLADFLPPIWGGHLLLTTRAGETGQWIQRLEVDPLLPEQAALLLLRRATLIAPDATLEQASSQDWELALRISKELEGWPLALDQAGAYIKETGTDLGKYLQMYQQHKDASFIQARGRASRYPMPVVATWLLSFCRVEEKSPTAANLLRFCAFLAPDVIPEEILREGLSLIRSIHPPLDPTVEILQSYSMMQRDSLGKTFSIHRLVQAVLQDKLQNSEKRRWAQYAVQAVNKVFPRVEYSTSLQWERLLPLALEVTRIVDRYQFADYAGIRLLSETAYYLQKRGYYAQAEPLFMQALRICEQQSGPEHLQMASLLFELANFYDRQRKYREAEPFYLRALSIQEQVLGTDHPSIANGLNSLALLYKNQREYRQAEQILKRALSIRERKLGIDHPSTTASLRNLAVLYEKQGKYEEVESLYKQALAIYEQQREKIHPDIVTSLNNLIVFYRVQSRYGEAESLYKQALAIHKQQLGEMHPEVATDLHNLAINYRDQGKYMKAEPLFKQALLIREQTLGKTHPDTQNTRKWYVLLLKKIGRDDEAMSYYSNFYRVNTPD